jgi:DNA-binding IscR family transcriptional regulator
MPLLSRKVDYALLILSYLHHRPEGGCAREIAARFSLSRAFVANILKVLCRQHFVASRRGMKGGYVLGRPAEAMCLDELLRALSPRPVPPGGVGPRAAGRGAGAFGAEETCRLMDVCPVRSALAEVHQRIRGVLRGVTLADLFQPTSSPPGTTQFGLEVSVREGQPVVP